MGSNISVVEDKEIAPIDVVWALEEAMRKIPGTEVANKAGEVGQGCKYEHSFTNGLYIRKMFLPKGFVFVTQLHKTQHPYFIMRGEVSVYLDGEMVRIEAPYCGVTEIGTKRALVTHEDTIWITVHVTDKTDVEEIKKDIVCETKEEYEEFKMRGGLK